MRQVLIDRHKDGNQQLDNYMFINPWRACATRITVVVLCVCVSVFSILPSRAFRRPTRGISSYSAENAVKLKSRFP